MASETDTPADFNDDKASIGKQNFLETPCIALLKIACDKTPYATVTRMISNKPPSSSVQAKRLSWQEMYGIE